MRPHDIFFHCSILITAGLLGFGYVSAGNVLVLPVLLVTTLVWIYARTNPVFWLASILLLVDVFLAAMGMLAGIPTILMITVCTTALISWDLLLFHQSLEDASPGAVYFSLERKHLQSLALATFIGLTLAIASTYFNLRFPFIVNVLLVLVTMGGLTYCSLYILKKKS